VVRLDWGTSWKLAVGQPVMMLIESRLGNTLRLMGLATAISLAVAVPIGIISAVKQYSTLDYVVTTFSFFGSSMPVFWFGLMMILVFSYKFRDWGLPFMPAGGVVMVRRAPPGQVLAYLNAEPGGGLDRAVHLVMPAIVLSLFYMASWSRFTRSSMLEVLRQDYIRTARAKGLRERVVLGKHALRNALIPLITIVVFQLPGIFGGATITETVFSYHGIGRLYYDALVQSDWPVVMVLLLITAILVVVATLLGDILYTIVDPRIRFE
jgi:peptide/nickel transport system permease protein